mgnify:CR=1 FL=1
MKQGLSISLALLISLIAACSKSAPADTVESLVANPERLKELRTQCKADHAKVGDAVCGAVQLVGKSLKSSAGRRSPPMPVDDRVAQYAVEPRP